MSAAARRSPGRKRCTNGPLMKIPSLLINIETYTNDTHGRTQEDKKYIISLYGAFFFPDCLQKITL